jgi:hypothetical protein
MSNHVVLRQIVELETPAGGESHHALSERLSHICRDQMPGILNSVFDRLGDERTQIDKLEIVIECLPGEPLEEAVARALEAAMEAALREALRNLPARSAFAVSEAEAMLFFLEHGYLPWYASAAATLAEWEYVIAEALAKDDTFRRMLRRLLQNNRNALERLLRHFSAKMPQRIVESVSETWKDADFSALQDHLQTVGFGSVVSTWSRILEQPEQALVKIRQGKQAELSASLVSAPPEMQPALPADGGQDAPVPEEGIFIRNAGAVLMHPFIEGLFSATGYYAEGKLTAPQRAAGLLHYAVCGREEAAEWELPLLKVLCGIPLSGPLPAEVRVSEAEQAEVEKMLESLIRYWAVLKNTSIAALRESFFQREGRLTYRDGYWHLKTEQRAYDVLLEHLPWGIGMIKLPWMTTILATEWV